MIDQSFIDQVRERNDIVDVISGYFPLTQKGNSYKALCPFHKEKTPSFNVNQNMQIYRCFGCGASGNVFNFVMDYEKITFPEAVRKLADRVGLEVPGSTRPKKKNTRLELIRTIYRLAQDHFRENFSLFGEQARVYLKKRQIDDTTIDAFGIGYALDSYSGLLNYLRKNHITCDILDQTGLIRKSEHGTLYDVFRDRIMFPIHDMNGRIIAFGGRILQAEKSPAKYINSPTTDIYTKGEELYGLYQSRHDIAKSQTAIIVEGYTDLLRLHASGFTNCVACLGTAMTEQQVRKLKRFTSRTLLLFDGDAAGRKAAVKAAGLLLQQDVTPLIVPLPVEDDPDSFLLREGSDALEKLFGEAVAVSVFLYEDTILELEDRQKIAFLLETIRQIEDPVRRELMLKEVAQVFQITLPSLLRTMKTIRSTPEKSVETKKSKPSLEERLERQLIKHILLDPSDKKKICRDLDPAYFVSEEYRKVFQIFVKHENEVHEAASFFDLIKERDLHALVGSLLMDEEPLEDWDHILHEKKKLQYSKALQQVNREIVTNGLSPELQEKKRELQRLIADYNDRVVRRTPF